MDFRDILDKLIEEAVLEDVSPQIAADVLLSESSIVLETGELLTEVVKRTRVKVAGGGYMTKRKIGRPNPRRSQIAKRSAMKGKSKRRIAQRSMRSKLKRKRTMQARNRLMGGARRGAHGTRRHGPPRRTARPKVRRPSRPKTFRPRRR